MSQIFSIAGIGETGVNYSITRTSLKTFMLCCVRQRRSILTMEGGVLKNPCVGIIGGIIKWKLNLIGDSKMNIWGHTLSIFSRLCHLLHISKWYSTRTFRFIIQNKLIQALVTQQPLKNVFPTFQKGLISVWNVGFFDGCIKVFSNVISVWFR